MLLLLNISGYEAYFQDLVQIILVSLFLLTAAKTIRQRITITLNYGINSRQPYGKRHLPVGNGRLGAMVFGDPLHERLQLNEESIWAGSKINNNNPKALKTLPLLQKAIFESRYKDALKLADENFLGTPPNIRSYQPLGDLLIDYEWNGTLRTIRGNLILVLALQQQGSQIEGKRVIQEVFASAPDNIICCSYLITGRITPDASFTMLQGKGCSYKS